VGGTGVVALLRNGAGPTVLVRTDMDALPVTERTGVPYASTARGRDKYGNDVGVMHACGHDMHMTCWVGTARVLAALKDRWAGTLMFIGQPAEEIGTGARLDLQTIVSRETNPLDPCVVTVGSIHGGTKHNIIPNEVKLQITVRTTKDDVRKHTLEAIGRIARAAAAAAGAPEPEVKVDAGEFTPALMNDRALARRTVPVFRQVLGDGGVEERPPVMGGEDFSRYGRAGVPIFMYWLGTIPENRWAAAHREGGPPLPSLHSDLFWPDREPTIRTGVLTMSHAVLNLVGK
jgi:metal-dependent amidase/aminoacylase/carboxypeptidase family protein